METELNVVKIKILDSDRFFESGLRKILTAYFKYEGITPFFVNSDNESLIDMLFISAYRKEWMFPCHYLQRYQDIRHGIIVIQDSGRTYLGRISPCSYQLRYLSSKARPEEVVAMMRLREERHYLSRRILNKSCSRCKPNLTTMEKKVLYYILWGVSQKESAELLGLSPKTISHHQRNAMSKLGLRRKMELYNWLRNGGLKLLPVLIPK